jgi:hypothetical protein
MSEIERDDSGVPIATPPAPPPVAPVLMTAFWVLLGGAAGINLAQSLWRLLDLGAGEVAVAVPVGGGVGALGGALLGLISSPRLLVLLMAIFAGASAGAVAGKLCWGAIGEVVGQVGGGLVGGTAWAVWLFTGRGGTAANDEAERLRR